MDYFVSTQQLIHAMVKLLLKNGSNMNETIQEISEILEWNAACGLKKPEIIFILLGDGAFINDLVNIQKAILVINLTERR